MTKPSPKGGGRVQLTLEVEVPEKKREKKRVCLLDRTCKEREGKYQLREEDNPTNGLMCSSEIQLQMKSGGEKFSTHPLRGKKQRKEKG